MTDAEKELIIKDMANIIAERSMIVDFAVILNQVNAIIQKYPQVLAEKCYEGEAIQLGLTSAYKDTVTQSALWGSTELTKIKVYIEVQS